MGMGLVLMSIKVIELWNLDDKVAKVIETGEALGFDFDGREEEISVIVAIREEKDEEERIRDHPEGGSWLAKGLSVDSVGSAGSLISLWNEEYFIAKACVSNSWCIIIVRELVKLAKDVVFCNVYAPNIESER
ncbi:hypothetical protein LWI28_011158 [Acer negundo]|uniref:Uncharacterized protein n=1 Tax=Acer negundo TaxID=4023 RepID=A0AAD5IDA6_ACENE|nr:hypothetical protein LWI28_011158 [Acer negundo]